MRPVSRDALRRHGNACDRGCGDLGLVLTGVDGFRPNMAAEICIEPCRAVTNRVDRTIVGPPLVRSQNSVFHR